MTNCFRCFGLLGIVLCAAVPQAHAGALYGVQYYYSVVRVQTACDGGSGHYCQVESAPPRGVFDNQLSVAQADAISNATYRLGALNSASASVTGTAQMGVLTIGGSAAGNSLTDSYAAEVMTDATAGLGVNFFDTLTIAGPGANADFKIHMILTAQIDHASYACTYPGQQTLGQSGYIWEQDNLGIGPGSVIVSACNPASGAFDLSSTVTFQTGKDYSITSDLYLKLWARTSPGGPNSPYSEQSHLSENASGTFSMYITPLTSGASFTAASGANYSETPEPATLIPVCSALLLLQTAIRKRQSR